jgi:hypothetical protein
MFISVNLETGHANQFFNCFAKHILQALCRTEAAKILTNIGKGINLTADMKLCRIAIISQRRALALYAIAVLTGGLIEIVPERFYFNRAGNTYYRFLSRLNWFIVYGQYNRHFVQTDKAFSSPDSPVAQSAISTTEPAVSTRVCGIQKSTV